MLNVCTVHRSIGIKSFRLTKWNSRKQECDHALRGEGAKQCVIFYQSFTTCHQWYGLKERHDKRSGNQKINTQYNR